MLVVLIRCPFVNLLSLAHKKQGCRLYKIIYMYNAIEEYMLEYECK